MNAVLSGRAGIAVIRDGERCFQLQYNAEDWTEYPATEDVWHIFGECRDFEFLEEIDRAAAAARLQEAVREADALDLTLTLLDAFPYADDTLAMAAEELEAHLTPAVRVAIEKVLFACPLPAAVNMERAFSFVQSHPKAKTLFVTLVDYQPSIRIVRDAWQSAPVATFAESGDREVVRRQLVCRGEFRDRVLAYHMAKGVAREIMRATTLEPKWELTIPEKILVAADHLEKQGQSPFTAEMLIVASWQKFPSTFGLKGFTDKHPDSNKILSSIMGEKGLARRGWLVKMGQKLYSMTREGRKVVRRVMLQEEPLPADATHRLNRDHDRFLKVLFDSSAVQKFEDNRKHELTFADASRFWGITENMKGEQIEAKLEEMDKTLAELDRVLADVDGETSGGRHVTAGDVRFMTNIHRYMEDRFERHLNLLRTRGR